MTSSPADRPQFDPAKGELGLIHTVGNLRNVFGPLAEELLPDARVRHVVDESLLQDAIARGELTPEIEARLAGHVAELEGSGVDAIMVTCSSMGQGVDRLAARMDLPVLRVDAAMVDEALRIGKRIGVLATLRTTMTPTVELVCASSNGDGRVKIESHVCEGAFEALKAGDVERHDGLVRSGLRRIEPLVDVVILAQASMARVLTGPATMSRVPILSSPRLAMEAIAQSRPFMSRPPFP
jgi:Asp/Glu/hydantoin racemase